MLYNQMCLLGLLSVLAFISPYTRASCVVLAFTSDNICYGHVDNMTNFRDETAIADFVALEAIKFTGGSCDDTTCDEASVKVMRPFIYF